MNRQNLGKQAIRARIRASRACRASATQGAAYGAAFAAQLSALVEATGARIVTSFVSVNGEPDTAPFHEWALGHGVRVLLPCALPDSRMEWAEYDGAPMRAGLFDIPEPSGARLGVEAATEADLMLVPAAAVDARGVRLGWGRGFYDRELARIRAENPPGPKAFAVVFDEEVVEHLPSGPHDEPVTGAVTEVRTRYFG